MNMPATEADRFDNARAAFQESRDPETLANDTREHLPPAASAARAARLRTVAADLREVADQLDARAGVIVDQLSAYAQEHAESDAAHWAKLRGGTTEEAGTMQGSTRGRGTYRTPDEQYVDRLPG